MLRNTHSDGINSKEASFFDFEGQQPYICAIWIPITHVAEIKGVAQCSLMHVWSCLALGFIKHVVPLFGMIHQWQFSAPLPPRLGRLRTSPRDEFGLRSAICAFGVARAASWGAAFSSWLNLPYKNRQRLNSFTSSVGIAVFPYTSRISRFRGLQHVAPPRLEKANRSWPQGVDSWPSPWKMIPETMTRASLSHCYWYGFPKRSLTENVNWR